MEYMNFANFSLQFPLKNANFAAIIEIKRKQFMGAKIRHEGVVKNIKGNVVQVQFVQQSACAHCEAKGHCNASESKEKIVDVECADAANYAVGDNVVVMANQKIGFIAVFYGAVLPMIIMLIVAIATAMTTGNELLASLLGLGSLAVYFVSLMFFREKLKQTLKFELRA